MDKCPVCNKRHSRLRCIYPIGQFCRKHEYAIRTLKFMEALGISTKEFDEIYKWIKKSQLQARQEKSK